MKVLIILLFVAYAILLGCSTDNLLPSESQPASLDERLVGVWEFSDTDMGDVFVLVLTTEMRRRGASSSETAEAAAEFRAEWEEQILPVFNNTTLRFDADGRYTDSLGGIGKWRTRANTLILKDEDGDEEKHKYFVEGDDLTLIQSFKSVLDELVHNDPALGPVAALFEELDFRLFFERPQALDGNLADAVTARKV